MADESRGDRQRFFDDVVAGLSSEPKAIAPKYFYDETGSRVFEDITTLDEYYLTRAETDLLYENGEALARAIGPDAVLIEPGAGSSKKTRIVLDRLERPRRYVPVDISGAHLAASAARLRKSYPNLEVTPIELDYTGAFETALASDSRVAGGARRVVFFPGSSIGNFEPDDAVLFLSRVAVVAGRDGRVIVGVDIPKDRAVLEAAYDDAGGVTARFNKNLLVRINRELDGDFDVSAFDHSAPWQAEPSRIEMRLTSKRQQRVRIGSRTFEFRAGEPLVTEHCYKWSPERFAAAAERAGLCGEHLFFDAKKRVSMHVFRVPT